MYRAFSFHSNHRRAIFILFLDCIRCLFRVCIFQYDLPRSLSHTGITLINYFLGWTSRAQFEETWAALLGVLSSPPVAEDTPVEVRHRCFYYLLNAFSM